MDSSTSHGLSQSDSGVALPLSMADVGVDVQVVGLRGGNGFLHRVSEMGLNVGARLVVRQREGGGLVVMRGETRFALGGGMAHRILVSPVNKE